MKKNDLAQVILFAGIGMVVSYVLANSFVKAKFKSQEVEVVERLSGDFPQADERVFFQGALDPTADITISPSNNVQPFRNTNN